MTAGHASASTQMRIERGDGEFPGNGGKVVEKSFQSVHALDGINQRPKGHASADENRRTTKYVGIRMDNGRSNHSAPV